MFFCVLRNHIYFIEKRNKKDKYWNKNKVQTVGAC
jgi:hypothetical protein